MWMGCKPGSRGTSAHCSWSSKLPDTVVRFTVDPMRSEAWLVFHRHTLPKVRIHNQVCQYGILRMHDTSTGWLVSALHKCKRDTCEGCSMTFLVCCKGTAAQCCWQQARSHPKWQRSSSARWLWAEAAPLARRWHRSAHILTGYVCDGQAWPESLAGKALHHNPLLAGTVSTLHLA